LKQEVLTFRGASGVDIRYQIEGDGPLVTLIHGVGANLESWDEIARQLASRFTVARADLRGHGRSGHIIDCSMADFVEDTAALLRVLGAGSTHLAGFSLGGLIAEHVALTHPDLVERLALISTVAERTAEERARVLGRADIVRDQGIASVAQAAEDRWFTPTYKAANPDKVERRLRELVGNDHLSYAAAYRVFAQADEGVLPERIRQPTLIMTGEHDSGSSPRMARFLHERITGSELNILPGLRHSVLLENPDLIAQLLLDFFSRIP
jgi:pimeloyl-ACP methyl ester carboxylesterase